MRTKYQKKEWYLDKNTSFTRSRRSFQKFQLPSPSSKRCSTQTRQSLGQIQILKGSILQDSLLLEALQLSAPADQKKINNFINCSIQISESTFLHQGQLSFEKQKQLKTKFHQLLNLYIVEEILKCHCQRYGWRYEKSFINEHIFPIFDFLEIAHEKAREMLEPYLREITVNFLFRSPMNTFDGMSPKILAMELTQTWMRIKQKQILLKSIIKEQLEGFITNFFNRDERGKFTTISKSKFFYWMFSRSQQKTDIISLMKINIFCHKAVGEGYHGKNSFVEWVNSL